MDSLAIQLAVGVGLPQAIGWFAPIFFGVANVLPLLLTLFFYADKSSEFNKVKEDKKLGIYEEEPRYDFIIVGSGSAGSVVANRLSKHFSVLLLEQGGEPNPLTTIPGLQGSLLSQPSHDYMYKTVPQNSSCLSMINRQSLWNSGRGLGGCHMLNGMVYLRGHPYDFDRWAKVTKDDRWSYNKVLPFFTRSEGFCDTCDPSDGVRPTVNWKYHGSKGELKVRPTPFSPLVTQFLEAQKWGGVERGDLNAPYYTPTADAITTTISRGRRLSTYHGFVAPLRGKRETLTVIKYARVSQILFEHGSNKAIGVKFERFGKIEVAKANKEVVLSAGAVQTPKLLMLSGIGPRDHLKSLNIQVRCNLPVGNNLQDHAGVMLGPFLVNKPASLLASRDLTPEAVDLFLNNGTGPYSADSLRAVSMWVSSRAQKRGEKDWPDVEIQLNSNGIGQNIAEEQARNYNMNREVLRQYFAPVIGHDAFFLLTHVGRPESRGTIRLRSSNFMDDPLINPRYYEDKGREDIKTIVEAIQRAVYLVDTAPSYKKIGAKLSPVPFPPCKKFQHRSDAYWECFARHYTLTIRHWVGSARMGHVGSPEAVVDPELKVIGVKGVRVIDASVMPYIVATNPNAATIMIAERGSEFVISDHLKAKSQSQKPAVHYY